MAESELYIIWFHLCLSLASFSFLLRDDELLEERNWVTVFTMSLRPGLGSSTQWGPNNNG